MPRRYVSILSEDMLLGFGDMKKKRIKVVTMLSDSMHEIIDLLPMVVHHILLSIDFICNLNDRPISKRTYTEVF